MVLQMRQKSQYASSIQQIRERTKQLYQNQSLVWKANEIKSQSSIFFIWFLQQEK